MVVNGAVVGAAGFDPGHGYSSSGVTIAVPACTGAPTITGTVLDLTAVETEPVGGSGLNIFQDSDLEMEGTVGNSSMPNKPSFGYAFAFTNTGAGQDVVRDIHPYTGSSVEEFARSVYTLGTKTELEDSLTDAYNPYTGDHCTITQGAQGSGVNIRDFGNHVGRVCDASGNVQLGQSYAASGFMANYPIDAGRVTINANQYGFISESLKYGQTLNSTPWFKLWPDGHEDWADGTGVNPVDATLSRTGTGLLGLAVGFMGAFPQASFTINNGTAAAPVLYTSGSQILQGSIEPLSRDWRWNGTTGYVAGVHGMVDGGGFAQYQFRGCTGGTGASGFNAETNCVPFLTSDYTGLKAPTFTGTALTGTGNAYACLNASGQLYRSTTACQ